MIGDYGYGIQHDNLNYTIVEIARREARRILEEQNALDAVYDDYGNVIDTKGDLKDSLSSDDYEMTLNRTEVGGDEVVSSIDILHTTGLLESIEFVRDIEGTVYQFLYKYLMNGNSIATILIELIKENGRLVKIKSTKL